MYRTRSMGPMIITFEGGNSEFEDYEHLVELNERLTEEVKNLKKLVFEQNERFTKDAKNMKELVVELYHAITMGHAPPPMPPNLSGVAPTIVHQAYGLPTTIEDPQYSPDFPHYNSAAEVAGSSTMCPLAPPLLFAPPSASAPQFTVRARSESLHNETEKTRDPRKWNKREFKRPLSYSQTPQKHHQQRYSPDNPNYSAPPLHKAQPYAPIFFYPQWRAPTPQATYNTPHNHFQASPDLPNQKRKNLCSCPSTSHKKLRRRGGNKFTPLGESYTKLFEKLQQVNLLKPISGKMDPIGKVDRSRCCMFHSGAPGHDTEQCWELKRAIQAMIDNNQIMVVEDETSNVNQNSLSVHDVQKDMHMIGTLFTEEEMKWNGAKQVVAVGPSKNIRRHDSSIVASIDRPNKSTAHATMQDVVVEPIHCLTQSFIFSKENMSTLMVFQENEAKKKMLSSLKHASGNNMVQSDDGFDRA